MASTTAAISSICSCVADLGYSTTVALPSSFSAILRVAELEVLQCPEGIEPTSRHEAGTIGTIDDNLDALLQMEVIRTTSPTGSVTNWKVDQLDDSAGTTYLITGANSGIGYEAAVHLRRADADVLLAARSVDKGEAAASKLRLVEGAGRVELVQLDLASLDSIARRWPTRLGSRPTDSTH